MYIFYPDVYFFSQFVTAVFTLSVITGFYRISVNWKRILLYGVLYGFVSTLSVICIHPFILYAVITHILYVPFTVYFVTKPPSLKEWLRNIGTSYAGIWILYGFMEWVSLQFDIHGNLVLTFCAFVLYILSLLVNRMKVHVNRQIPVILRHRGAELRMTAFCDTGNLLRDPYCKKPVHVVSSEVLSSFLSETGEDRYRLIPYETVTGKELMKSYTFDELILCKKTPIVLKNVVIGMARNELFRGKSIQLLLNVSQLDL